MADVAARLVAWHNRHLLARRIAITDVSGIGVVALPYAWREGSDTEPLPLYDSDWMHRVPPSRLHAWVRRHGQPALPGCDGWPRRQIDPERTSADDADAKGLEDRCLRLAITASVTRNGHHARVLMQGSVPAQRAAVFGSRLWDPARTAGLAGALAGSAGLFVATAWWMPANGDPPPPPVVAAIAAVQPAAPASTSALAIDRVAADPLAARPTPAPTADLAAPAPTDRSPRPLDVQVTVQARADGHPPLVDIRPSLGDGDRRAVRAASESLRRPGRLAPPAGPAGRLYAIATLPMPNADDARAQRSALQGLVADMAARRRRRGST